MKKSALIAVLMLIPLVAMAQRRPVSPVHHEPAATEGGIDVYFSPKGGSEAAIVAEIGSARKSVSVQAYSFTSTQIAKALEDAHARGVAVRVVMDRNAAREAGSVPTALLEHGVPMWTDGQHPIAHNKIVLIDGATIITGSFNLTRQAENSNAENLLILRDHSKLAKAYVENFEEHLAHAVKFTGEK